MKILRQTESELVVQDSSVWLTILLALCSTFPLGFALFQHDRRAFLPFACILLFAIPWLRRSTYTFDAASQTIRWVRLRYFRLTTGVLPFSNVETINIESTSSTQASALIYRLAIATPQGIFPMSDTYSGGRNQCTSVREAILRFLKLETNSATSSAASDLDPCLRSLLQQGRKIDAIQLLKASEHLSLTAAARRVNELDAGMNAEK